MKTEYPLYQDVQISYFISSNSSAYGDEKRFAWPQLPDKSMGEEFIQEVKAWHYKVKVWIQDNPKRFKSAVNGVYEPISTHKPLATLRHKPTGRMGCFITEYNHSSNKVTTQVKITDGGSYFACSSEFEAAE